LSGPQARISAQAKLNLYLRVLNREESGYHTIETIFHRIDYADELMVLVEDERQRTLDVVGGDFGPVTSNLAYRAAVAYQESAGWPRGFTIKLEKQIPSGAGLGGGSADAAAVLRALDSLARAPLGERRLLSIAAALGADIPFLVSREVMALAWGHGERMLALPPLPQRDVLLVIPEFRVATADAYAWLDKDRAALGGTGEYETADLLLATEQVFADWHALAQLSRNSFLNPVAARHPQIRTLFDQLKTTDPFLCGMSGSGSTLFGVYERPPDAGAMTAFEGAATTATRTSTQVVQPIRIG
jgi:4-diphosphocytidyl-2-C-methyl-D-erythritol kinase